jgi:hypothetical protein
VTVELVVRTIAALAVLGLAVTLGVLAGRDAALERDAEDNR